MSRWVEETFHPHWRVRLEADEVLHEVKTEHQHLVIFKNATWGTVLMLDGVCQLTTSDEFIYHEMMAHVPLMALDKPKRVLVVGGGDGGVLREVLEAPLHREGDAVRDRPHGDRHRAEVLPRDPRRRVRRRAHGRRHRRRAQVRRRDGRALRRHHRRQLRADRAVGGAAHGRVLRRLQARAEGGRHPHHAERPAVLVPRPPGADDARLRLAVRPRRALLLHAALLFRRARSRSTGPPTRTTTSTSARRSSPSARRSAASKRATGRPPCTTPPSRCRPMRRSSSTGRRRGARQNSGKGRRAKDKRRQRPRVSGRRPCGCRAARRRPAASAASSR